ncbi:MAG TPA: hypothetical protein PLW13_12075 [Pseudomonadales bacterium]|nr:hypothetical protein [Pseudomonadales bacterium]
MELIVSHPNLHPVWAKVLGLQAEPARATHDTSSASPLAAAIAAMTDRRGDSEGWQATHRPQRPGAPVAMKKRLGPGLWISTVVKPGDAGYPTHS